MSRYIDKDKVLKIVNDMTECEDDYKRITNWVHNMPTIDIVRCKECRHWKKIIGMVGECESDYMWSTLSGEITEVSSIDRNGDDFCSYGEREGE